MYKLSKSNTVFHFLIYPAMLVFLSATENHSFPVGSSSPPTLSRRGARSAARSLRPSGPRLPRLGGTPRRDFTGTKRPCEEAEGGNGDTVLRQQRRRGARPCPSVSPRPPRAPSFPPTLVIFCALRAKAFPDRLPARTGVSRERLRHFGICFVALNENKTKNSSPLAGCSSSPRIRSIL